MMKFLNSVRLSCLMVLLMAVLQPSWARAETIRFKNGNVIEAAIVEQTEDLLTIDIPGTGQLSFPLVEIDDISARKDATIYQYLVLLKNQNILFGDVKYEGDQVRIDIPGTGLMVFHEDEIEHVEVLDVETARRLEQEYRERAEYLEDTGTLLSGYFSQTEYGSSHQESGWVDEEELQMRAMLQQQANLRASLARSQELAMKGQLGTLLKMSAGSSGPLISDQQAKWLDFIFGIFHMFGGWIYLIGLLVAIYYAICIQTLAQRTDADIEWMAWVPILHLYLACQIAGKPWWWVFLYAIPVANLFADVTVWMGICKTMGKPQALGFLALIPAVNVVMVGYVAFSGQGAVIK